VLVVARDLADAIDVAREHVDRLLEAMRVVAPDGLVQKGEARHGSNVAVVDGERSN
jgi:hypothetical protein